MWSHAGGASFSERSESPDDDAFKSLLRDATSLLPDDGMPADDANEQRQRLLAGFRWILVDEYQDIGQEEYELIAALAGLTLEDEDDKLTLFAVGDDDQNIYTFKGASVKYIRAAPELYHVYKRPGLDKIDLGFAGRSRPHHRVHRDIAALHPGDSLSARLNEKKRWELFDQAGNKVGRLTTAFEAPEGMRCLSAKVLAIITRKREQSKPEYQERIESDAWEVVVPEMIFGPETV